MATTAWHRPNQASLTLLAALIASLVAGSAPGPAAETTPLAPPAAVSPRLPTANQPGHAATMAYHSQHSIDADTRIGDGFIDGGRGMKIRPDGSVSSSREILTVDRTRDAELRKELEFARSRELAKLDPLERAARIGRRVTEIYRGNPAADSKALESERRNQEVLIGDVAKITGNQGVCRHRSLLFKLLADEAGLKVALVRGYWAHDSGKQGAHAWNELHLADGRVLIVDTMRFKTPFPDTSSRQAGHYFTVDHKPRYFALASPPPPSGIPAPPAATR